jgi:hypothetical protein
VGKSSKWAWDIPASHVWLPDGIGGMDSLESMANWGLDVSYLGELWHNPSENIHHIMDGKFWDGYD